MPSGFRYQPDFLSADEEARLVDEIGRVEFSNFEMRGVVARRRVAFFGRSYDTGGGLPSPPLPPFLLALREKVGAWAGVEPSAFAMALINEYRPGAPIGWHRDAPQYDLVAGVSLLSPCRMKLRPYVSPFKSPRAASSGAKAPGASGRRIATHEIVLEPRSAYLLSGEARTAYEHHIPAGDAPRYSITFRTLRAQARPQRAG